MEDRKPRGSFPVELRKPNGETLRAEAFAHVPFIALTPPVPRAHVMLFGVSKSVVPIETEIWTLETTASTKP